MEGAVDVRDQLVVRRRGGRRERADDGQAAGRKVPEPRCQDSTQATVDPVPQNRVAHRLVHNESDARRAGVAGVGQQVENHRAPRRAPPGPDGATEVVGPAQPVRRGQHEVVTVERVAQAARR